MSRLTPVGPRAKAGSSSSWLRPAQNAIERRVTSSQGGMALQQSRFLARTITWVLVGTTVAGFAWLALAKTDEVVVAPGKLEPIGNVKTVQMPAGGVLDELLVKEGERVKKGQVLIRLDNEATVDRLDSIRVSIAAKKEQLRLKGIELVKYTDLNDAEQTVLARTLQLEEKILNRLDLLMGSGAVSDLQVLQQRNKVKEVEGEINKLRIDRLRQVAILRQDMEKLNSELSDLQSQLTELSVNIRYQDLRSPVDGVVFDLKPKGGGFVAQTSEPVMKIVPYTDLQAKIEIASSDIGFVRVGKEAEISIDSFPDTDFGVLHGKVSSIGSDALPPDEVTQYYRFPAVVTLDSQQLALKDGKTLPLQVGMSLRANIKLRKVTYLQLLLGEFKSKADSLKQL
jgi:hemolysin D